MGGSDDRVRLVQQELAAFGGVLPVDTELPLAVAHADGLTLADAPNIISPLYAKDVAGAATWSRISSEVALSDTIGTIAGDRAAHWMLCPKRHVTALDTVVNSVHSTSVDITGDEHDIRRFTCGRWYVNVKANGVPIDLRWILQLSPDGTNWFNEVIWWWNKNVVDDTAVASGTGQPRMWPFETNGAEKARIRLVTNVSSGNFTATLGQFTFQAR